MRKQIVSLATAGAGLCPSIKSCGLALAAAIGLAASAADLAYAQGLPVVATRLPAVESQPFALPPAEMDLPTSEADQRPIDYYELGTNVLDVVEQTSLEKRLAALEGELKKSKAAEAKKKEEDSLKPVIKPRGRLHTDLNFFTQSAENRAIYGDVQDGAYFRRARLGFDAKMFEVTQWRLDFEMGSGGVRPSIFDAYVRVTDLPYINNFQVGHFREPFSLEAQTSSNWLTFIERASNNTFDPSRNWGMMAFNWSEDERFTWAAGVFREGSDLFGDDIGDSGEWAGTARSTYLLSYDEPSEGRYFWEVGGSYSYRDPDNRFANNSASGPPSGAETSIVNYSSRPENNLNEDGIGRTANLINVSILDANNVQLYGVETSANYGSFNIQSEFICALVDRRTRANVFYHGAYVQASYFLTGESRRWERRSGTFGRAEVLEPFFMVNTDHGICTGWGAWELIARWNYLDLSEGSVGTQYGYVDTTSLGCNWYLNPYVYLQLNYDYADVPTGGPATGGNVNVYHARWNMHF
ncbi:MAG: OprO/OprP family phosphate-selective porin [Pirellulaceae bacterium]